MAQTARRYTLAETYPQRPTQTPAESSQAFDFDQIFAEYGEAIYSYIYRLMGNAEDARDFTQDTFIRAYTALPRMPADLQIRPWLYRIATNICLDELRRRKRIRWTPWERLLERFWDRPAEEPGPERVLVAREDAIAVQRVLNELPPRYRSALLLREYQDLSYEQMATALRTTVGGVKSLLYRAREAFRLTYERLAAEENWGDHDWPRTADAV